MLSTKEEKIRLIKLVAEELEQGLTNAVNAGADRNDRSEMDVFSMYKAALDVLEDKVRGSIISKTKRDKKLDN